MVHVSATDRCSLSRISTCIFLLLSSRSNNKMNFQTESYFFFHNNFKIIVLDSLMGYFHIV